MKKSELKKLIREQIRLLTEEDICGEVECQCSNSTCRGTFCYDSEGGPLQGLFDCSCCECVDAAPTIDNKPSGTLNIAPTIPIVSPTDSIKKIRRKIREAIKHNHIAEQKGVRETHIVICDCANENDVVDALPDSGFPTSGTKCIGMYDDQAGTVDCSCCDGNCAPIRDKIFR